MDAPQGEDRLVSVIPVHFTNALEPQIHLHQFPLLTRPLEVPPSAAASGKRIRARVKSKVRRLEVHVPVDTRAEVWNAERSKELGTARVEDDKEKNQELPKVKQREVEEPRLPEVRMRSEQIPHNGTYILGVLREGRLHLHPISETHQFRPTLTYMDMHTRKTRRNRGGDDSDEDDGPPPDPDEPAPAPAPKKEKKPTGPVKEIQVAVRKTGEASGPQFQGGMSQVRREMLTLIHAEEDERWEDFEYCGGETAEANEAFESVFSTSFQELECKSEITSLLKDVPGL
ncbi:DNA-directed RNA polymerase III subunit Rpc5 [Trametes elegans]|nr:DNA-directed RNA polymerase III subunit Rpc5 [Trametes elegans]